MPFYDQGPCYNQNFSDDQPPFYSSYQQQQFDCCEVCGGPHYSSDCQTRNQLVYEPSSSNNYDFPCFDQPPQYHIDQSPPQDLILDSLMRTCRENNRILEEMLRTQMPNSPVVLNEPEGSDDYTKVTYDKEQCLSDHYTAPPIPARETYEFLKSSVDDFVPIPREFEVTSDSVLECDMPATTPLPPTDNGVADFDIDSPLGEYVVDFLMENDDVAGLPRHLVKYLFNHLLKNPSLTKGMSDEPLGDDTISSDLVIYRLTFRRAIRHPHIEEKSSGSTTSHSDHSLPEYESFGFDVDHIEEKSSGSTTSHTDLSLLKYESFHFDLSIDPLPPANRSDSHLEEFADELANIISPPEYDHFYFDLKDINSLDPPESTSVIDESTLLVTPLPDSKEISLREVERFDPFFSLTQSGEKTRVMETPSFGFYHMPSPRPAAYSPKEVMYRLYHPHHTSGD
ncbi:hypothetical protein Tco_0681764 [Tanacetum coccineum]|uniref:NAC domain-containing protein n=1 Tax=Tanacetum coccineum TaxID=301880 RepID=A0ABQ4XPD7_9ASTR